LDWLLPFWGWQLPWLDSDPQLSFCPILTSFEGFLLLDFLVWALPLVALALAIT
jgi:hypothetical protein